MHLIVADPFSLQAYFRIFKAIAVPCDSCRKPLGAKLNLSDALLTTILSRNLNPANIGEGQTRKQIGRLTAWRAWLNVGGTVFSILSLDEGGIKGAFRASVLATLEEDTGRKVRQNAISVRPRRRAIRADASCYFVKAS